METNNGSHKYFADAAGRPVGRPTASSQVASPVSLLSPDRYEFYTFNDNGDLVKRLMTLDEIQGIIAAGGDGEGITYTRPEEFQVNSESRVHDVVANVQSVLKEEMAAHQNGNIEKPSIDAQDLSSTWSMILPSMFGQGDDAQDVAIIPDLEMMDQTPLDGHMKLTGFKTNVPEEKIGISVDTASSTDGKQQKVTVINTETPELRTTQNNIDFTIETTEKMENEDMQTTQNNFVSASTSEVAISDLDEESDDSISTTVTTSNQSKDNIVETETMGRHPVTTDVLSHPVEEPTDSPSEASPSAEDIFKTTKPTLETNLNHNETANILLAEASESADYIKAENEKRVPISKHNNTANILLAEAAESADYLKVANEKEELERLTESYNHETTKLPMISTESASSTSNSNLPTTDSSHYITPQVLTTTSPLIAKLPTLTELLEKHNDPITEKTTSTTLVNTAVPDRTQPETTEVPQKLVTWIPDLSHATEKASDVEKDEIEDIQFKTDLLNDFKHYFEPTIQNTKFVQISSSNNTGNEITQTTETIVSKPDITTEMIERETNKPTTNPSVVEAKTEEIMELKSELQTKLFSTENLPTTTTTNEPEQNTEPTAQPSLVQSIEQIISQVVDQGNDMISTPNIQKQESIFNLINATNKPMLMNEFISQSATIASTLAENFGDISDLLESTTDIYYSTNNPSTTQETTTEINKYSENNTTLSNDDLTEIPEITTSYSLRTNTETSNNFDSTESTPEVTTKVELSIVKETSSVTYTMSNNATNSTHVFDLTTEKPTTEEISTELPTEKAKYEEIDLEVFSTVTPDVFMAEHTTDIVSEQPTTEEDNQMILITEGSNKKITTETLDVETTTNNNEQTFEESIDTSTIIYTTEENQKSSTIVVETTELSDEPTTNIAETITKSYNQNKILSNEPQIAYSKPIQTVFVEPTTEDNMKMTETNTEKQPTESIVPYEITPEILSTIDPTTDSTTNIKSESNGGTDSLNESTTSKISNLEFELNSTPHTATTSVRPFQLKSKIPAKADLALEQEMLLAEQNHTVSESTTPENKKMVSITVTKVIPSTVLPVEEHADLTKSSEQNDQQNVEIDSITETSQQTTSVRSIHAATFTESSSPSVTGKERNTSPLAIIEKDSTVVQERNKTTPSIESVTKSTYKKNTTKNSWKLVPTVLAHQNETVKVKKNKPDVKPLKSGLVNYQTAQRPVLRPGSPYAPPTKIHLNVGPPSNVGLEITTARLGEDIRQFSDLCNELAFKLWNYVTSKGQTTTRSVFLSPFAITSMLAMVFLGARGPTSGEMNDILKLDDMVTFNPHLVFRNITESIEVSKNSGVASSAIIRELYSDRTKGKLLNFYKERAQQFYDGHVEEANFKIIGDVIRRRTNLLVKRQTWGKVTDYIKGNTIVLRPPLAALSANIFQIDCALASNNGRDGELYFIVSPTIRQRRLVPIPAVVYRSGFLAGYEPSIDATAISLGNEKQIVSTIFVLPGQQGSAAPGDGLLRLEQSLSGNSFKTGTWSKLLRTLTVRPGLEIQIPRFSHRSVINTTLALQKMGLKELFNPSKADLRGLNGNKNELHLSDMIQVNTFTTCGESPIGDSHHVEIYPATPNRLSKSDDMLQEDIDYFYEDGIRDSKYLEYAEEPRDYQRAFHDPVHDPSYLELPLALRPRQARIPEVPRLRFDRPFLYFVRHNPTGLILHMGRFNPRLLP